MLYLYVVATVCFLGLAITQSPPPQRVPNICTGIPSGTFIPDVSNCHRYYSCPATGVPISLACTPNFFFNVTSRLCQTGTPAGCFRCPSDVDFEDVPLDYQCIQFARCFAGSAQQRTCSEGLLFDPVEKQCNVQQNVTCGCPAVDIPSRPLFVRDWDDCSKYHVCSNGTALEHTCPSNLKFNIHMQQCDHPSHVNCTEPISTGY